MRGWREEGGMGEREEDSGEYCIEYLLLGYCLKVIVIVSLVRFFKCVVGF